MSLKYADLNYALTQKLLSTIESQSSVPVDEKSAPDEVVGGVIVKRSEIDFIHDKSQIGVFGDSAFLGTLARYFWDVKDLSNRTATGKGARIATGGALSPDKYAFIKGNIVLNQLIHCHTVTLLNL